MLKYYIHGSETPPIREGETFCAPPPPSAWLKRFQNPLFV